MPAIYRASFHVLFVNFDLFHLACIYVRVDTQIKDLPMHIYVSHIYIPDRKSVV